jgi:hypothetical protein
MDVSNKVFFFENRQRRFIEMTLARLQTKGFAPYAVATISGDGEAMYQRLAAAYEHRSVNSAAFELQCFQRYFAMSGIIPDGEAWFMMDSDVVMTREYATVRDYFDGVDADVVGSVGFGPDGLENQVSPHFTVWTRALALDFCDFVVATYEGGIDTLIARIVAETGVSVERINVSDMVLLQGWVTARRLRLFNTNRVINGMYIDHNISQNLIPDGRFSAFLGTKMWRKTSNGIGLALGGTPVEPISLHFPGRYKKLIAAVVAERPLTYRAVALAIFASTKIK